MGFENSFICSTLYSTKHILGPFSCPWLRCRGFSNTRTCILSRFSHVWLFATLWTVSCQTFLSMGFSRGEYWNGFPCRPPGDLHNPGTKSTSPMSPTLVGRFLKLSHQRNLLVYEANFFQQFYAPEYKIPVNDETFFHDNEIIFYIKLLHLHCGWDRKGAFLRYRADKDYGQVRFRLIKNDKII